MLKEILSEMNVMGYKYIYYICTDFSKLDSEVVPIHNYTTNKKYTLAVYYIL
jgi:hypothetical protein